jgi:hypothetical protein
MTALTGVQYSSKINNDEEGDDSDNSYNRNYIFFQQSSILV